MFDVTLITMGKLKEKFYISAADEYKKRLGGYCRFTLLELPEVRLPDDPSQAEIFAGLEKEADLILSKIPKGAWFCVFTPEGTELSSEKFAKKLKDVKLSGKSTACFLIGSSFGIAPRVKERADFKLSMGPMTFPHHLARIMVLEQLYRAEAIQAGSKYHKYMHVYNHVHLFVTRYLDRRGISCYHVPIRRDRYVHCRRPDQRSHRCHHSCKASKI